MGCIGHVLKTLRPGQAAKTGSMRGYVKRTEVSFARDGSLLRLPDGDPDAGRFGAADAVFDLVFLPNGGCSAGDARPSVFRCWRKDGCDDVWRVCVPDGDGYRPVPGESSESDMRIDARLFSLLLSDDWSAIDAASWESSLSNVSRW